MRAGISLVSYIACLGLDAQARADWQYTKWGMNIQQVVSAAGRDVEPGKNKSRDTPDSLVSATGRYASSGIVFRIDFGFSRDRGLNRVVLTPDASKCATLTAIMARTYGPIRGGVGSSIIQSWRDTENGNFVAYTHFDLTNFCQIEYSPLPSAGGKGGL